MRNPHHAHALTTGDLTIGRTIAVRYAIDGSVGVYVVLSAPYSDRYGQRKVRVYRQDAPLDSLAAIDTELRLNEIGVEPNGQGRWRDNYTIAVD